MSRLSLFHIKSLIITITLILLTACNKSVEKTNKRCLEQGILNKSSVSKSFFEKPYAENNGSLLIKETNGILKQEIISNDFTGGRINITFNLTDNDTIILLENELCNIDKLSSCIDKRMNNYFDSEHYNSTSLTFEIILTDDGVKSNEKIAKVENLINVVCERINHKRQDLSIKKYDSEFEQLDKEEYQSIIKLVPKVFLILKMSKVNHTLPVPTENN